MAIKTTDKHGQTNGNDDDDGHCDAKEDNDEERRRLR